MCFEALVHSGKILDKSDWSFVFYSDDIHFPKQTDGNSCGIYLCSVAHAIILNYRLPDEPNLVRVREIFATEIIEGALNEGMRSGNGFRQVRQWKSSFATLESFILCKYIVYFKKMTPGYL